MLRKVRQYPVRQCGNLHLSDLSTLKFCSRDSEIVQERNEVALANPSPRYEHVRKLIVGLGNPGDKFTNTRHNIGFIAVKHFLGTYVSEVTGRSIKLKYDASSHGDVVRCRLAFQQKAADKKYAYPIDDLVNLSSKRAKGRTCEKGVPHEMVNVALLLPTTYMNCSGTAVRAFMKSHRWQLKKNPLALNRQDELLVISDDVALPFGECRFKPKGGSGGQNGVRDIIKCLGTERFARLRIGIGAPYWFTGGNSGAGSGTAMDKYVLGRFNNDEQDSMPDLLRYINELIRLYLHRGLAQATTYANSMDLQGYLKATRFE
ncbi:putative peptidyl-tRNA hydrolase [Plasmopara halstedii]